jgi:hypothetical protein
LLPFLLLLFKFLFLLPIQILSLFLCHRVFLLERRLYLRSIRVLT